MPSWHTAVLKRWSWRELPLDVIVCDLNLPDMEGFDVVRMMRSDPTIPYRPVCI